MFWDRFYALCEKANKKPNVVAKELQVSSGIITKWKAGSVPSGASLEKLADYFGVSTDYLLGRDVPDREIEDMELREILDYCANRPEGKMLFSLAKGASADDVRQAIKIIEALQNKD